VGCFLEAGHGAEALKLLHERSVSAVLTDLNMPVMDGEQLVMHIQQDEILRSIPVVMISTDSTDKRIHRLLDLGARGYITKPFAPERLREELERVLAPAA
jgi:two-component system chemotaxis response regulator CheY